MKKILIPAICVIPLFTYGQRSTDSRLGAEISKSTHTVNEAKLDLKSYVDQNQRVEIHAARVAGMNENDRNFVLANPNVFVIIGKEEEGGVK
jgi:hypothetical protein